MSQKGSKMLIEKSNKTLKLFRKIINQDGELSLLFLIILPVTMLILFSFFANAQVDRDELDFIRACQNELDLTLADYDRQLWNEFGLWGTDINKLNQNNEFISKSYMGSSNYMPYVYDTNIEMKHDLSDNQQFKKQILRHMSYRAPALLIDEIIDRYSNYSNLNNNLSLVSTNNLGSELVDPEKIQKNPENYLGDISELDVEIPKQESSDDETESQELTEEEQNELSSKAMELLGDKISEAKSLLIPVYESSGTDIPANPLDPNSISTITSHLDSILVNNETPVLDSVLISEYLFNYYTMHCSQLELNTGKKTLVTPDGRKHQTLIDAGRKHEIEQIVFNEDDPEKAYKTAKNYISGICFSYHLIDCMTDQVKQNIYFAEAIVLSGAIALASLGGVVIDPEPLSYLFMLIDVCIKTHRDVKQVISGKMINLKFSDIDIKLNYKDFMRMFLLTKSEDALLEGMTRIREKTIPKQFAVSFVLSGNFENKEISMHRSFSDYRDSE